MPQNNIEMNTPVVSQIYSLYNYSFANRFEITPCNYKIIAPKPLLGASENSDHKEETSNEINKNNIYLALSYIPIISNLSTDNPFFDNINILIQCDANNQPTRFLLEINLYTKGLEQTWPVADRRDAELNNLDILLNLIFNHDLHHNLITSQQSIEYNTAFLRVNILKEIHRILTENIVGNHKFEVYPQKLHVDVNDPSIFQQVLNLLSDNAQLLFPPKFFQHLAVENLAQLRAFYLCKINPTQLSAANLLANLPRLANSNADNLDQFKLNSPKMKK